MKPSLWIAYDYLNTNDCLAMLDSIITEHPETHIIHEIGRPTIIQAAREGVPIIQEFRNRLTNNQVLVTDFKGFDIPYLAEGKQYYAAGSDLITVMATAPNEAVNEVIAGARSDHKQVAFDLMTCLDENWKAARAKELVELGATLISCHTGCSEQAVGKNSHNLMKLVFQKIQDTPAQMIAMGGLKPKDVAQLRPYIEANKIFAIVAGSAITGSKEPNKVIDEFLAEIDSVFNTVNCPMAIA